MNAHLPGRTWLNSYTGSFTNGQALVVDPTDDGEKYVALWVSINNDGPAVQLTAKQCREVAATLTARADLIDPGPVDAEIVEEQQ